MDWGELLGKVKRFTENPLLREYARESSRKIPPGFFKPKASPAVAPSGTPYYLARPSAPAQLTRRSSPMPRNVYGDPISYEDAGMLPPRRRRRGITARDLASFRRVANLIRKYAAPVRHFRKHPKGR